MNKSDMIDRYAELLRLPRAQASELFNKAIDVIALGMIEDGESCLANFGIFRATKRPPRMGVDLSNGQRKMLGESVTVSFKPAPKLRAAVVPGAKPVQNKKNRKLTAAHAAPSGTPTAEVKPVAPSSAADTRRPPAPSSERAPSRTKAAPKTDAPDVVTPRQRRAQRG